jgi:peptide-methionine (R)-S-oxide reductase
MCYVISPTKFINLMLGVRVLLRQVVIRGHRLTTRSIMSGEKETFRKNAEKVMSKQQYDVCFNKGTERPFTGEYLNHKEPGTFACAVCATPLFSSSTKFESGTGWPSFYDAIDSNVAEVQDDSLGISRIELLCRRCDCHLGHVFEDGPTPTGRRFCVNSASLKFKRD